MSWCRGSKAGGRSGATAMQLSGRKMDRVSFKTSQSDFPRTQAGIGEENSSNGNVVREDKKKSWVLWFADSAEDEAVTRYLWSAGNKAARDSRKSKETFAGRSGTEEEEQTMIDGESNSTSGNSWGERRRATREVLGRVFSRSPSWSAPGGWACAAGRGRGS
ncbi:hypothetical protein BDY21DRAFT_140469 [Lineolata rhizophorae]|uniref:Uncharacterized protein n=1 Tax=Lineolata rhizophorae TaxID=578093 RepID=A0A6A6PB29_9PEZI|nr:hypothetical protein BDY21DRAFT_140469 [Lineolata rhizophorae]